jgi:hypothetical protein
MKQSTFFELLEKSVIDGHRASRSQIEEHYKKSRMCFEDYVKSMCNGKTKEKSSTSVDENDDNVSKSQFHTVRNIAKAESIDAAVNVMLYGGWDFVDRRRKMNKSQADVEEFLEQCKRGRAVRLNDLPKPMANLLGMIADAWLDWAERTGVK